MYIRFVFRFLIGILFVSLISQGGKIFSQQKDYLNKSLIDPLLGPRVNLPTQWNGSIPVDKSLSILVLAGHADSQGLAGSGTSGAAVDLLGAKPMQSDISDELFWNLLIRDEIVKLGKQKGLNIKSYDPPYRNIINGNHPKTNWSIGARHAQAGGYVIEIHFDSYGKYGFGSGLIPAITRNLNTVDESLAKSFGKYPLFFRGGLGGPRRGIRILEIGKLEGELEKSLRDIKLQKIVVRRIAGLVVNSIINGFKK